MKSLILTLALTSALATASASAVCSGTMSSVYEDYHPVDGGFSRGCDYTGQTCDSYTFSYVLNDLNNDDDIDIFVVTGDDCDSTSFSEYTIAHWTAHHQDDVYDATVTNEVLNPVFDTSKICIFVMCDNIIGACDDIQFSYSMQCNAPPPPTDSMCSGQMSPDVGGDAQAGDVAMVGCEYSGQTCYSYTFSYVLDDANNDDDIDIYVTDGADCSASSYSSYLLHYTNYHQNDVYDHSVTDATIAPAVPSSKICIFLECDNIGSQCDDISFRYKMQCNTSGAAGVHTGVLLAVMLMFSIFAVLV